MAEHEARRNPLPSTWPSVTATGLITKEDVAEHDARKEGVAVTAARITKEDVAVHDARKEGVAVTVAREDVAVTGAAVTDAEDESQEVMAEWAPEFMYWLLQADAVRPKSQASPGAGGVGVAQTAPLVLVAVGALLVTVARRRSAPASTML